MPDIYWRHRIQMAKAMGCNTIAAYVFWNYHELQPGKFDFTTGNRNIARFIRICQEEGMWVLLRPGPLCLCRMGFRRAAFLPACQSGYQNQVHGFGYMAAATRYINRLAAEVKPLLCTHGGPILMVQVENEYGSFGNDKAYMENLRQLWKENGIDVPFYTADGATPDMLDAGAFLTQP